MLLSLIRKNVKRYWRIARRKKNAKERLNLYDRFCVAEILGGMNMSGLTNLPHNHISITSLRHRAVPCRKATSSFIWQRKTGADRQDPFYQRGKIKARKKTHNKWFETQDSISYWEDFNKPKIVYPNMTKYMPFVYDDNAYCTNQKCFIITGQKAIAYLTAFFNSSLFKFCFRDSFPN